MIGDRSTRTGGATTVQLSEEVAEKIDSWCDEFRVFFGWKVKADYQCATAIFDVVAKRFDYHIVAKSKYLGAVVQNKRGGQTGKLVTGGLNFQTFAKIMMEVMRLESAWRKT
jgi:hypothetical protein